MMQIVQDNSVGDFLEKSDALLYQDEAANNLMIGLCERLLKAKEPPELPPTFLRVVVEGVTVTGAIHIPPKNLGLTYANQDQLKALALFIKENHIAPPGVIGPAIEAKTFAKIWSELTSTTYQLARSYRLYKIERVNHPDIAGKMYLAQESEVDLTAQWLDQFDSEALLPSDRLSLGVLKVYAQKAIENQTIHLWTVGDKPVSMALLGRHTRNGVSIGGVYTPTHLRKNGYASALVASLSQKMLDSGKKFCVLNTDLTNSTSNKIYQNVGYREVLDTKQFSFENL